MPDSWTVPGYTHVRDIGAGGAGRVVLAVDDVTTTPVAIKYLLGDTAFFRRFRTESHALSRIEDPNLVQVYEYAESPEPSGGAAVVTEYVEGVSLRRLLDAEDGVGPEAALSMLSGSLLALAALHDDAGMAHRAFRPENILIATDGTTKISDAGIGDAAAYKAPEREAGPAADLYAATAVFVECLTGANAVPGPFRDLVDAGLSADPRARPRSAADFLTELDEIAGTAYGEAWERTGRAKLAEHAARAAPYTPSAHQPAHHPAPQPAPEPDADEADEWTPLAEAPVEPPAEPSQQEPAEIPPVERSPFGMSPFGPSPFGDPHEQAPQQRAATGSRPPRRSWPARLRVALVVGIAVIVAAGATWYIVSGRNPHDPVASAQAGSPTPARPSGQPGRPPAAPADLAATISRTVASRRTATFIFRATGVAAQGALKFNGAGASAYDMRVTPLNGGRADRRHPVSRVILVDDNAYVARGGWKSYPAAAATDTAAGKRPRDPGRLYTALAAETRWGSSVNNILALLAASTKFQRTGLTYRGVAGLSRLTRERAVADLYRRAPRRAVVTYTIEMAQNLLPRQLTVTIKAPGGRRTYRTTYTGWGQRASITPPRRRAAGTTQTPAQTPAQTSARTSRRRTGSGKAGVPSAGRGGRSQRTSRPPGSGVGGATT